MRFCDWFKQNRLNRKLLQIDVAKALGKKQAYISLLESTYPTPIGDDLLKKVVEFYNADYKEILLMVTLERLPDSIKNEFSDFIDGLEYAVSQINIKSVPFITNIPKGFIKPLPSMKYEVIQLFENSLNIYHPDLDFFTVAFDDALLKAGIKKGDICLVSLYDENKEDDESINGEIVLAEVSKDNDTEIMMRYFHLEGDFVLLLPDNPDFRPQIVPRKNVRVIGVILKTIRIFNHLKNHSKVKR